MKKYMLLMALMLSLAAGCANSGQETDLSAISENSSLEVDGDNSISFTEADDSEQASDESPSDPEFDEFVDMLYVNPESYLGKTVTVNGEYMGYLDDYLGPYTHGISKWDELGCCPLIMDFALSDDFDFPAEGSLIEITGVYSSYTPEDFDWTFYYVDASNLSILDGGNSR